MLAGETVRTGERDCAARWQVMRPHLSDAASVLDIGANFGWFGLQICAANPKAVVASVEADLRSAEIQRIVLQSHAAAHHRICLLTAKASANLARQFEEAETRFDAALCLNVLHWVGDHRELMVGLGRIADIILVEHPDPSEAGSGVEKIRREIGPIGPYLSQLFPDRVVERLAFTDSHRDAKLPRELWLVNRLPGQAAGEQTGIAAAPLLNLSPAWPPRSWWNKQFHTPPQTADGTVALRTRFQAHGLSLGQDACTLKPRITGIPESSVASWKTRLARALRRRFGELARKLGWRG